MPCASSRTLKRSLRWDGPRGAANVLNLRSTPARGKIAAEQSSRAHLRAYPGRRRARVAELGTLLRLRVPRPPCKGHQTYPTKLALFFYAKHWGGIL
jgi:hypothetical protein